MTDFYNELKKVYDTTSGDHDRKVAVAWRSVNELVKKGQEDAFDQAVLKLEGITPAQAAKRSKAAIKSIEAALYSPEVQKELRLLYKAGMYDPKNMCPENALD